MLAKVRYIITYEDDVQGYSFKLWRLFNHRCDLYTAYVKWYPITGYNIIFPVEMLPIADCSFMGIFHEECLPTTRQKTGLDIVSEILKRTGVLASMKFVHIQRDLYPEVNMGLYRLSDNGVMVPQ
jgi:hypothetical protein